VAFDTRQACFVAEPKSNVTRSSIPSVLLSLLTPDPRRQQRRVTFAPNGHDLRADDLQRAGRAIGRLSVTTNGTACPPAASQRSQRSPLPDDQVGE
jgi:hypothetical protein